jgi:hypothetical protein
MDEVCSIYLMEKHWGGAPPKINNDTVFSQKIGIFLSLKSGNNGLYGGYMAIQLVHQV